jgi:hypothetical protein
MRRFGAIILLGCLLLTARGIRATDVPTFRDLFNGKDLAGWVNVNTAEDTWRVKMACWFARTPIGVMRTTKQYRTLSCT